MEKETDAEESIQVELNTVIESNAYNRMLINRKNRKAKHFQQMDFQKFEICYKRIQMAINSNHNKFL